MMNQPVVNIHWSEVKISGGDGFNGRIVRNKKTGDITSVELRKSYAGHGEFGQLLIIIGDPIPIQRAAVPFGQTRKSGIRMSMNGPCVITNDEWNELNIAITIAQRRWETIAQEQQESEI